MQKLVGGHGYSLLHELMIAGEGGEVTDGYFIILYMNCNSCNMIILLSKISAYFSLETVLFQSPTQLTGISETEVPDYCHFKAELFL